MSSDFSVSSSSGLKRSFNDFSAESSVNSRVTPDKKEKIDKIRHKALSTASVDLLNKLTSSISTISSSNPKVSADKKEKTGKKVLFKESVNIFDKLQMRSTGSTKPITKKSDDEILDVTDVIQKLSTVIPLEESLRRSAQASLLGLDDFNLIDFLIKNEYEYEMVMGVFKYCFGYAYEFNKAGVIKHVFKSKKLKLKKISVDQNLIRAVQVGHIEIIRVLLDNGADINYVNPSGMTLLSVIIEKYRIAHAEENTENTEKYKSIINFLIENNINLNYCDSDGNTPLTLALKKDLPELAKEMIIKGVNVNYVDADGNSLLSIALNKVESNSLYEEIASLMIEKGANLNHIDKDGHTPITISIDKDLRELVKLMVEKGANLIQIDAKGRYPFKMVSDKNDAEIIKLFRKNGINWIYEDPKRVQKIQDLLQQAVLELNDVSASLQVATGANTEYLDEEGNTFLTNAVIENDLKTVEFLVTKLKAKIDAKDSWGNTPFMIAMFKGYHKIAHFLFLNRANINATDVMGSTSLIQSVLKNSIKEVKYFIKFNADVTHKNFNNQSALTIVAKQGSPKMKRLFSHYGYPVE